MLEILGKVNRTWEAISKIEALRCLTVSFPEGMSWWFGIDSASALALLRQSMPEVEDSEEHFSPASLVVRKLRIMGRACSPYYDRTIHSSPLPHLENDIIKEVLNSCVNLEEVGIPSNVDLVTLQPLWSLKRESIN